jgi:hypothetical protein
MKTSKEDATVNKYDNCFGNRFARLLLLTDQLFAQHFFSPLDIFFEGYLQLKTQDIAPGGYR